MIIDTPDGIKLYTLLALKQSLKLQAIGMKFRGKSPASQARSLLKTKTKSCTKLLDELTNHIDNTYGKK